jgi:aminopeptidase N
MFPCWDEPVFKAQFQLTVHASKNWKTLSNMPIESTIDEGDLLKTAFAKTPRMSSYLLTFTAGDLSHIDRNSEGVDLNIWAPSGQEKEGLEALENASQILADYNRYFQVKYPLSKMESIAIPGGFAGAMENWGAISYNEALLLTSPLSTGEEHETVFSVQSHEMAHQWFGDLVTMTWWDDLWLNESFASWMAAKETEHRHPDWQWQQRQDRTKESAMSADSFSKSHPILQKVSNELEAMSAFDPVITYDKGQAVLRMLESYMGESVFQKGIAAYMKAHQFSSATSDDLWQALEQASGKPIRAISTNWVKKPGFPLITAQATCSPDGRRVLHLSQQRFLLDRSDKNPPSSLWMIPINLNEGDLKQPKAWLMSQKNQDLPAGQCGTPITLNEQGIGYFRVLWDPSTLNENLKFFNLFSAADRINFLDDQWALVQSHQSTLKNYMNLVQAIEVNSEIHTREWEAILASLEAIRLAEIGRKNAPEFHANAIKTLLPLAEKLGWEAKTGESSSLTGLRGKVWMSLGLLGDANTIQKARQLFNAYLADPGTLSPDLQSIVFKIVAKYATESEFNQLVALTRQSSNMTELVRYFEAIMAVGDENLAKQALDLTLSSNFPVQLRSLQIELVGQLSANHPVLAWETFKNHYSVLLEPHATFAPLILASSPEFFWNAASVKDLKFWAQNKIPPSMKPKFKLSLDSAKFQQERKLWLQKQTDLWLESQLMN